MDTPNVRLSRVGFFDCANGYTAASAIWMVRVVQLVPVSCRLIDILHVSAYFSTSLWFYAGGKLGVKSRCCRRLRSLGVFAKTGADHPEHSEDC